MTAFMWAITLSLSVGQGENVGEIASANFRAPSGGTKPNVDLPKKVSAADGKVTLFADFMAANEKGVTIYIVNRSGSPLVIPAQDGSLFLKLAVKQDGNWRRAQSHAFSDCGNSYHTYVLPAGQYLESVGYKPKSGEPGTIRFQLKGSDGNLISNEGLGLWNLEDVADSSVDAMAEGEEPRLLRFGAEENHGLSVDAYLTQLKLLKAWSDGPVTRLRIRQFRDELVKLKSQDAVRVEEAIAKLDEIAALKGTPEKSRRGLLDACVMALREIKKDGVVAHGGNHPLVAWHFLHWLSRNSEDLPVEAWKEVFEQLQNRLPAASREECGMIDSFIRSNPVVHEYLSSEFLAKAAIKYPMMLESCAERLGNRSEWKQLVTIGEQVDEGRLPMILGYYCVEPSAPGAAKGIRMSSADPFMEKCIRSNPWECFNSIRGATGYRERVYMEPGLSLLYWDICENFLKTAEVNPFPFSSYSDMSGLVRYLENSREQDGISPGAKKRLERVLKLGDIQIQGETEEQKKCRQQLKAAADRILVR
jgi:hypothetical protein